jgi:type I restriction enzyme S subunit
MVNYTDVYGNVARVLNSAGTFMQVSCPSAKAKDCSLRRGDILFTPSSETPEEIGESAVVVEDLPGTVFSYHLLRFRPTVDLDVQFSKYLCNNEFVRNQFAAAATGTIRQTLSRWDFRSAVVPVPPLPVQRAIANFLDRKTAAIDTSIEKNDILLALHHERHQALARRAVTGKEERDGATKESGIDWFGLIPRSWRVLPARRIFEVLDGRRVPVESEERAKRPGDVPYYGASGIIDYIDTHLFDEPLVLVCEDGWNLLLRTQPVARPLEGKAWVNNHAHVLRPRFGNVQFWAAALELTPFDLFVTGMRQPKLTMDALLEIPLASPSDAEEMTSIAKKLRACAGEHERASTMLGKASDLLREYRRALISAAMSGQLGIQAQPEAA